MKDLHVLQLGQLFEYFDAERNCQLFLLAEPHPLTVARAADRAQRNDLPDRGRFVTDHRIADFRVNEVLKNPPLASVAVVQGVLHLFADGDVGETPLFGIGIEPPAVPALHPGGLRIVGAEVIALRISGPRIAVRSRTLLPDEVRKIAGQGMQLAVGSVVGGQPVPERLYQFGVRCQSIPNGVVEGKSMAEVVPEMRCAGDDRTLRCRVQPLCQFLDHERPVDVMTIGIAKPQIGADRGGVLTMFGGRFFAGAAKEFCRIALEFQHAVTKIDVFVEEFRKHGAYFGGVELREFADHERRVIVPVGQKVSRLGERLFQHGGKIVGIRIPVILKMLDRSPLVFFVLPSPGPGEFLLVCGNQLLQPDLIEFHEIHLRCNVAIRIRHPVILSIATTKAKHPADMPSTNMTVF